MSPQVSVILAAYNEDKYLGKCLKSLAQQKSVSFEVIIVDDGSRKNLKSQISNLKSLKNFKFFRISHGGTARARNFGAKKAKGKILVFLDADMKFEKGFLKNLTKSILQKRTRGTFSTEEFVANWQNIWARCWNWENDLPDKRRIDLKRADMVRDFRAILKKEFDRVAGFDDIGYTDTWTLSEKLGYKPSPTKAVYYHYNPDNLKEIFTQSIWIGGRKRRWGIIGKLMAAVRASLPFSIIFGIKKSIQKKEPRFLIFKTISDLGALTGIIKSFFD
jgi:glycosyltransferase involved in cell wall biosynthesis